MLEGGGLGRPPPPFVEGRGGDATGTPRALLFVGDKRARFRRRGGGHKASVSDCLPLAVPIGLSPPLILTLCGSERVLVVSTEPPDDLSCLTTPGVGRPGDGAVAHAVERGGGGGSVLLLRRWCGAAFPGSPPPARGGAGPSSAVWLGWASPWDPPPPPIGDVMGIPKSGWAVPWSRASSPYACQSTGAGVRALLQKRLKALGGHPENSCMFCFKETDVPAIPLGAVQGTV